MKASARTARPSDAEDIARLSDQLGYPIPVSAVRHNLDIVGSGKNEIVLVAILEEKIVGWIHVRQTTFIETGTFYEIGGLVVDDQHRRKGIGTLLIENIKTWCNTNGICPLRVRCNVKRKAAHEFYRRLGFSEKKEQKVFEINL